MENKINNEKENILLEVLKGKTVQEATDLLFEALRIIKTRATIS